MCMIECFFMKTGKGAAIWFMGEGGGVRQKITGEANLFLFFAFRRTSFFRQNIGIKLFFANSSAPPINIKWLLPNAMIWIILQHYALTAKMEELVQTLPQAAIRVPAQIVTQGSTVKRVRTYTCIIYTYCHHHTGVRGNSTVVSVSVYQAGGPGSLPALSACYRKVECYHCFIDWLPPVPTTG